ncbi:MAG: LamG-like jellyroll fold domain-containing protein, partial [Promethearchaeota archaeon]
MTASNDPSSGTAPALPVSISGQISNVGHGTMTFDSSSSGVDSVSLTNGWTGTDLQAQIDSLTWTAEDVLQNGNLNKYHYEQFMITSNSAYNSEAHRVPDGWTLVKNVANDIGDNAHPNHGVYELYSHSAGYGSTWGVRFDADWGSGFQHTVDDEIYFGQMITLPWREVYSVEITFKYYVYSTSNLADQVHLFVRLAGETIPFHVFEPGDTTDTWLTATTTIQAASMSSLAKKVAEFDIGLTSGLEGTTSAYFARVHVDDIKVDFTVRPFPEQIDLKANGTLVWGSTTHSIYPYVPDDSSRDCYDASDYQSNPGIDLNGFGDDGGLGVGIYDDSGTWDFDYAFQAGLQFPLDIPAGAIVTSAYLEVEAMLGSSPELAGMRLYIADAANSPSFTTGLPHLENRYTWLDTYIPWSLNSWITSTATRYRSPEIGPLVQNVIANATWAKGNYITIMLDHMYSDYYQRWNDIEGTSNFDNQNRARLFVEYIVPKPKDTVYFFNSQKDIIIDHTKVASDLTDFPVLIDITDSDLRDHVLSNGNDIAFTIGGTTVEHDVELYDQTTGHLVCWIKVPSLSSTTDTVIKMLYGSLDAPPSLSSRVWDEYETVQHLANDPSGTVYDSTSNNHDGTSYGDMTSGDLVPAIAGNGINFDFDSVTTENSDMINIGQIFTDDWTSFTVSLWVYMDINRDCRVFSKSPSTTPAEHIMTTRIASQFLNVRLRTDVIGGNHQANTSFPLDTWQYITWMWDASSDMVLGYLNGTPVLEASHSGTNLYDNDNDFVIANNNMAS